MRSRAASPDSAEHHHSLLPATQRDDPQSSPANEDPLAFSSPPGSLLAELSPTQTLAAESPELPPLPPFPVLSRGQQSPLGKSEPVHPSDRSGYYTASWGSPYQQIPVGFKDASKVRKGSITTGSDDIEDGSPSRFNLGHLIPTRLPTYHGTTPTRPSTPTRDFKSVREALLDARSSLDDSLVRERDSSASDVSETGDEQEDTEWDLSAGLLQATPSATRPQPGLGSPTLAGDNPRTHKTHMSNRTVRQEDIWEALGRSRKEAAPADIMQQSKYAVAEEPKPVQAEDLAPADTAPADAAPTEEPEPLNEKADYAVEAVDSAPSIATAEPIEVQPTPAVEIQEPAAPAPPAAPVRAIREKKKMVANGKTCWILLPPDVPRTEQGAPLKPLTPAEIANRLETFEKAGFDTRGFSNWSGAVGAYDGTTRVQNRPVFPEVRDIVPSGSRPSVRIPDKRSWDDYMNQLTEMKLAALGVSLGGDPTPQPGSAPLSRQSSSQYPTSTFSPPPLSSSAASQQQIPGFPPGFVPGHASRQSMVSPISSTGNPRQLGHMHRQSMFVSPPAFPTQPTPPGLSRFSPQHFSRQSVAGNLSTSSPAFGAISATAPLSAGGTQSPASPFAFPATQSFPFNAREDLLVQMQRQQQQLQAQQQMQAQSQIPGFRPMSVPQNLQEVPEAEEEDEMPVQQARSQLPEIANPRPRHSKNVSMQLERDAEKDDYHLENYMKKDFVDSTDAEPESAPEPPKLIDIETPAKQAPEPLAPLKAAEASDTTPSSKAEDTLDLMTSPTSDSFTSGHVSKASSVSKFNVEAKEFKFNPSASFNPGAFSPNNFTFQSNKVNPFSPPLNGLGASFRPAATSFDPSASTGSNSSLFGNQDFSFSTTFNPGASTFQPGGSVMSETDSGADSGNRIFGNIKFGDIIKPPKKSKAIPIVRPEDVALPMDDTGDEEPQEDESGRLAQADGRQKRARQGRDDGDDVPRFAFPSHPLDDEKTPEPETISKALEKEGSATPTMQQVGQHRIFSRATDAGKFEDSGFQDGPEDNAASIFQQMSSAVTADRPKLTHERKKSSLSATAKPFEFNKPWTLANPPVEEPIPSEEAEGEQQGEMIVDFAQQIKEQMPSASSPILNISDQEDGESADAVAHAGRKSADEAEDFDFDPQPDFENIDEIMKQLNEAGSDIGVERTEPSWQQQSSSRPATATTFDTPDLKPPQMFRSDAPSPSPRRALQYVQAQEHDLEEGSPINPFGDQAAEAYESQSQPVLPRREVPASDWDDDDLSAEADVKVRARGSFFDEHVDTLLQRAIATKMEPLERTLAGIQLSLTMMSERNMSRRELRRAREREDSDADDEDETEEFEGSPVRSRSVPPNKRLEQIKSVVRDALVTHSRGKTPPKEDAPTLDPDEFYQALADVKASAAFFASKSLQFDEVKELVEDALERQRAEAADKGASLHALGPDSQHVADLAKSLAEANTRADQASEARKMAEAGETRLAKELSLAEEELKLLKARGADDDNLQRRFEREREELKDQISALEEIKSMQQDKLSLLADQNTALEGTLKEHRSSHESLRRDLQTAHQEKLKQQSTLDAMQYRAEEAMRVRSTMRDRLADLREEMRQAAHFNSQREAKWHHDDQEHRKRYEVLTARIGAEARTRERLEQEMERLENRERDAMRLKIALDESQSANDKLEEQIGDLNMEIAEQRKEAERYARQFREARDEGRSEVQRVTVLMQAEMEASNSQANIARADLEAELERVQTQLEHMGIEAESAKERHEVMIGHEVDARNNALSEQQDMHHRALQEQVTIYEQRMEELRQQHSRALDIALEERNMAEARLMDDHKRSISRTIEDKERSEALLNERLTLADSKFEHLQDKVVHLEEKLAVAKDAAQAAVQAARTARSPGADQPISFGTQSADAPSTRPPEKISPQALRESIAVLQEQLQAREARIEELEAELEPIRETPAQLKHRETEVTWLREILDVRQQDLTDLINALAQPTFNREGVKNAAIRIRANLQMELQEKERLLKGGAPQASVASQVAPALASISNFASPKAAQLAAAIGNWRKASVATPSGLRQSSRAEESAPSSRNQTPSKPPNSAQSFLSGLMTPPQSNLRRTPSPAVDAQELSEGLRRVSSSSSRQAGKQPSARGVSPPPRLSTPPLLTDKWDYDDDAEQAVADLGTEAGAEEEEQEELVREDPDGFPPADGEEDAVPFETFQ